MTTDPRSVLVQKIDLLSPRAKQWLHHAAQQVNDSEAGGYMNHEPSRSECAEAGIITVTRGGYIEFSAEANDLLYSQGYLHAHA